MGHPGLWAHEDSAPDFRVFEFRCGFNLPVGSGHIDGLMASEGARRRIAIYWIEPTMFCEAEAFVRYSDFIFDGEAVNYWIHGMTRPALFGLRDAQGDLSLPEQETPESVVRSALGVVSRLRGVPRNGDIPLEVDTFFVRSRDQPQYNYDAFSDATVGSWPVAGANSVAQVLDALPFGREYSKNTRADGTLVWCAKKGSKSLAVTTVSVRRIACPDKNYSRRAFDAQTLGEWELVPEAYRAYWSLDLACDN